MRRARMLLLVLFSLSFAFMAQAAPERRVALVIGNAAYKESPLKNPVNDATDMAEALKDLGFEVILKLNANLRQMEEAVDEFWGKLKKGGSGLFFFAGHGLQVSGRNYLVPVDAKLLAEQDVKFKCLDAGLVLGRMENAGNGLNIIVLDACRNNPYARSFRSSAEGLARMDAPTGSLIAYATAPDSVAADGEGRNGVYTAKLLKSIRVPGLPVEQVFKRVRDGVMRDTKDRQVPWESTSLRGDFYFAGNPAGGAVPAPAQQVAAVPEKKGNWFGGLFKKKEPELKTQPAPTAPAAPVAAPPPAPAPIVEATPAASALATEAADAEIKALQEELAKQEAAAKEAKTKAQQKAVAARKAELKKQIEAAKQEKERAEAEAEARDAEAAVKVPEPPKAGVDLQDLKKKSQAKAKAEAEVRKKWAAWQSGMKAAVLEAEKLERDKSLSAEDKADAWQRLASRFAEDNPYSEEDDKLRSRISARTEHWTGEVSKPAAKKAAKQQQLAMSVPPPVKPVPYGKSQEPAGGTPGRTWQDPMTGMDFVWVPGGAYEMGCGSWTGDCGGDEKPVHTVRVDGFWLGKFEVTQGQWQRLMGSNPASFKKGDNYPVEEVSWNDAKEFISRLNSQGSARFRLPSEAEWEFAARSGGKPERFAGGNDPDRGAWHFGNSGDSTHPVGTKAPNGLGLYDMNGNVWEWCEDFYAQDFYSRSPRDNPVNTTPAQYRVVRGGSWSFGPTRVRSAIRNWGGPVIRKGDYGFRLVRVGGGQY